MGKPGIDPTSDVGTYVDPLDWNSLLKEDNTVVIDTRNYYEVMRLVRLIRRLTLEQIHLGIPSMGFGRLLRKCLITKESKIAMFCTGVFVAKKLPPT